MHLQPKLFLTYSILIFCVIAWGSNFVIGKILIDYFHPYTITLVRLIAINLFLWLFLYRYFNFQNIPKKIWVGLAFSGLVGIALNQYTFFLGLVTASPVTSALILALAPITTSILTFIVFKEKRLWKFWGGGIIALIGVLISVLDGGSISIGRGDIAIIITMLTFAIFIVFIQWLAKYINSIQITLLTNAFGLAFLLPFLPTVDYKQIMEVDIKLWALLIVSGIIVHGVSNMLWNKEMPKVGAANASLLMNLEPFIAMVGSALILGSHILLIEIIGAILIISGVILALYKK
ncbi:MAG TPA: DMT family transporter, partial [Pseudogracilibacillus sp.]|nr:DMT family transporter [Pseudogracilibacillus sp.]